MKRVMIVDDAIDLGRLLQDALKVTHPDTPITVVPSAEEALLESTRFKFDLVITDIRLPGMSGLELIRKIRVRQPEIKVILITALLPDDRLVKQKDEVRPDVFIRKPLSVSHFLEAVDGLIGSELAEAPEAPPPAVEEAPAGKEPKPGGKTSAQSGNKLPSEPTEEPKEETLRQEGQPVALQAEPEKPANPAAPQPQVWAAAADAQPEPVELDLPGRESITSVLARLRGSLGAQAVLLTDGRGNLVSLEGDLPEPAFLEQVVPAALAPVDACAGISDLLGPSSGGPVQAYRGTGYDLVIAAAGGHILFIVLKTGSSSLRLALAFEEVLSAQADLELRLTTAGLYARLVNEAASPDERLQRPGVTRSLSQEEIEAEENDQSDDPELKKLEELFSEKGPAGQGTEDPDTFWEAAAAQEGKEEQLPGILSYDQAQELGLLNPDEEEE